MCVIRLGPLLLINIECQGVDDNSIASVHNLNAETSNRRRRIPVIIRMCIVYAVFNFRSNVSDYDLKSYTRTHRYRRV